MDAAMVSTPAPGAVMRLYVAGESVVHLEAVAAPQSATLDSPHKCACAPAWV
jgi:hypothetical protein